MRPTRLLSHAPHGFTLVELAVAVAVIALLIGTLLVPLATQIERRQTAQTEQEMEAIKEALIGFALAQTPPRLPCPYRVGGSDPGTETYNAASGRCITCPAEPSPNASVQNLLPWASLGLAPSDAWGNRYVYRVMCRYAARPVGANVVLGLDTGSNLTVCADALCVQLLTVSTPENAPAAVILSHGPNGRGAVIANAPPGVASQAPVSADEVANWTNSNVFVSHPPRAQVATPGDEFDDLVAWLSPHVLKSRLVAAGKLP